MKLFILLQYLLPQILLTKLFSYITNASKPRCLVDGLINWFIRHYKVDVSLAAETNLRHYKTFNEFFIRRLKSNARKLASAQVISPVDGTISQIAQLENTHLLQAKNILYSLSDLLANDNELVSQFIDGSFTTLYLAPKDYHRVHMPVSGKLLKTIYVPGKLFSVNAVTAENVVNLFARNERLICEFETALGKMVLIFVGALFVAGIHTVWAADVQRSKKIVITDYSSKNIILAQGAEAGYFKFGSTVILLFSAGKIIWKKFLIANQSVVMGEKLA